MFSQLEKRAALPLVCCALFFLYLFGLTRAGLLGPDEPRYAAIGRSMAESGDWVTPRLWGQPWFEKPALLYWMTAAGFKLGLGDDLAPRLPVAMASLAFLIFFFAMLRAEFGERVAFYATSILATSVGWLAFSHVAVPDLPMSAAFGAAMLLALRGRSPALAGVCLGAALLAKGLVPLALCVPVLWFWRKRLRDLAVFFGVAAAAALPWYALVTLRNGTPFLQDFFWKHHFARFLTGELMHGQPIWFYVPVLAAAFFPWSPLLLLLFSKKLYQEPRQAFLLAWLVWGFVFFSLSHDKLPGYLLPLLPALAALLGIAIAGARPRSLQVMCLIGASAALLWLVPAIQDALARALVSGLSRAKIHWPVAWLLPAALVVVCCAVLERIGRREIAIFSIGLLITLSVVGIVSQTFPMLDREVSARGHWLAAPESITCVPNENRSQQYGLDYYVHRDLPDCP